MSSLAIVGAGAAGLAAAHALAPDLRVTVFEKSRGLSGRAATRWRDAPAPDGSPFRWRYDHGAQYVELPSGSRAEALVRRVAGDDLVAVDGAVWPFDDDGTLRPDLARTGSPHWTFADGIAGLGRRIVDATPELDLRLETRVARLVRPSEGWLVEDDDGTRHGPFDAVLLTPPAPQTADLLAASDLDAARADALREATYRSQFAVVWAFDHVLDRPGDADALVNRGGRHAVAWIAVESDKPGRAPDGASLLLAQMSDAWTRAHYDDDRSDVVRLAAEAVAGVWGPLPEPLWTDTQRWRYSSPAASVDASAVESRADGLFVAGDFTAAKGRVDLALEQGLAAAERIRARL